MDYNKTSRTLAGIFLTGLCIALLAVFTSRTNGPERKSAERFDKAMLHAEIRAYILENPDIIFEAAAIVRQREAEEESKRDVDLVKEYWDELQNDGRSYVGGNPEGDITLVEFLDYRCGYCRKAFEEVEMLLEDDGNIRFIIKEFPILGEASMIASQFAIAVRNIHGADAYKSIHDTLMTFTGEPTPEVLVEIATTFGLEPTPIFEEMMSQTVMDEINENRALGQKMQISGTPTFVFGEALLRGYLPLDAMREVAKKQRGS